MPIPTISYEDFSTSNQALVEAGGPWIAQSLSGGLSYGWVSRSWCGGYCLLFDVSRLNAPATYRGSFVTNISINLANYGGATSLDFTWGYWPLYCGSNTTAGSNIPITSQVGDAPAFGEGFPAVDYNTFFNGPNGGHQWDNASKISHHGSTSLVHGSDPNLGYIAIKINVTMEYSAANHNETLFFYAKDIGFLITTPPSSSTSSAPVGVVAGAVAGAVAFVALVVLAVWLLRRRHRNQENPVAVDNATGFTVPTNNEAPKPLEEGSVPPPHLSYHAAQQPSFASIRPDSFVTRGPDGPPPTYGPDELTGQDREPLIPSSPLARFAAANREAIDENMEARLQAAGYVPTQDPSRLTPEEWREEYGITRLELKRLQNLYARTQQDQHQ